MLYPTPISETLELVAPKPFKATLQEPPIPGDSSATATDPALPAYVAYQGDGDVTAGLVYVNYGMQDDYKTLERLGVNVKGKIVIARYGRGWRGLKPKLAQEHGAVGCIIYSDPADDGYSVDATYPARPDAPAAWHPARLGRRHAALSRRSADAGRRRDQRRQAADDRRGHDDPEDPRAADLLRRRAGVARRAGRPGGAAGLARRAADHLSRRARRGGRHLAVKSDWSLKPIYDVIAIMKGSTYPDQWVVRGNHHDGWVFGASDPLSGQVALLAEAKAIGGLVKHGWRPKRTIVYASWDGEEPMLAGLDRMGGNACARAEEEGGPLHQLRHATAAASCGVGGSHDFQHLVNQVAADVIDPETGVSIGQRLRAKMRVDALDARRQGAGQGRQPRSRPTRTRISRSRRWARARTIQPFSSTWACPRSTWASAARARTAASITPATTPSSITAASSIRASSMTPCWPRPPGAWCCARPMPTVPLQRAGGFADAVSDYLDQVKKLADNKREEAETQAQTAARPRLPARRRSDQVERPAHGAGARPACRVRAARRRGRSAQAQRQGLRRRAGEERSRPVRRPARAPADA